MEENRWSRVYEIKAKNAHDFIRKLEGLERIITKERYQKGIKENPSTQKYIFRGQGNSEWKLIPSAFRAENAILINYLVGFGFDDDPHPNLFSAIDIVNEFTIYSDKRGLKIPGLTNEEKFNLKNYDKDERLIEMGSSFSHRMALAQHYGLPTPFLDWTEKYLVACYFAASNAIKQWIKGSNTKPDAIAVWALNIDKRNYWDRKKNLLLSETPFQIHDVPKNGNENLVAQQGLFTYWEAMFQNNGQPVKEMESRRLDSEIHWNMPMLVKLKLDVFHAGILMQELFLKEIDASTMFPGYYGAAQAVLEFAGIQQFNSIPEIEKRWLEFEEQKDKTE